jgi:hypothetical protein
VGTELGEDEQVGLPPAILKHAGGMFHLFIIRRTVLRYAASTSAKPKFILSAAAGGVEGLSG